MANTKDKIKDWTKTLAFSLISSYKSDRGIGTSHEQAVKNTLAASCAGPKAAKLFFDRIAIDDAEEIIIKLCGTFNYHFHPSNPAPAGLNLLWRIGRMINARRLAKELW